MGESSPSFGVNIKKIFELPPPRKPPRIQERFQEIISIVDPSGLDLRPRLEDQSSPIPFRGLNMTIDWKKMVHQPVNS